MIEQGLVESAVQLRGLAPLDEVHPELEHVQTSLLFVNPPMQPLRSTRAVPSVYVLHSASIKPFFWCFLYTSLTAIFQLLICCVAPRGGVDIRETAQG